METFSLNTPINLPEEGKWLLAVTSVEATNSVFQITDESNSFSISTPSHWNSGDGDELVGKLKEILELRYENDIKLHVGEDRKKEIK